MVFATLTEKLKTVSPALTQWKRRPEILLLPNIPKPLHGLAPRVILGSEWWDKTRKTAYASTLYHCVACGVHKRQAEEHAWLEGHEVYETRFVQGRLIYRETVPLCHYCHCFIHSGRLESLRDKKEITCEKYDEVMRHGERVLKAARLRKKEYLGRVACWSSWRLVLFGREYKPLWKNIEEWAKNYDVDLDD